MNYQTILAVGSGGFLGAIARVYLIDVVNQKIQHAIPFGTLSVNLTGSFFIGILFAFFYHSNVFSTPIKSFLTTGLLGGFTTFSTFAIEALFLIQTSIVLFALYASFSVAGSVLFAYFGYKVVEYFYVL